MEFCKSCGRPLINGEHGLCKACLDAQIDELDGEMEEMLSRADEVVAEAWNLGMLGERVE